MTKSVLTPSYGCRFSSHAGYLRSFTGCSLRDPDTLPNVNAANPDTVIGRLIDDRYRVRSLIARGGMATVYVATDLRLDRRVAIKIMHDHLAADEAFRDRFIREARAAARLAHPNLVNVYDQGEDGDLAYMVMEYVPGITLRDLLHDHHRLTVEQTIDIMDALLAGLQVAHRQGIVHRDIKPENVLLADDGRIKLSDFGLARAATSNTATGSVLLGTIAYLAPELVTQGSADVRSDIYSAGIMMYELLVGEQPYRGDEPVNIAFRHANDDVPPPSEKQPGIPQVLDDLVLWATERNPDDRPADAGAMLAALRQAERDIAAGGGAPVPPGSPTLPSDTGEATRLLATADDHGQPWHSVNQPTGAINADPMAAVAEPMLRASAGLPATAARLERINRQKRRSGQVTAVVVVLLMAFAGVIGWWQGYGPGSYLITPDLAGMSEADARQQISSSGFVLGEVHHENSLDTPAGQVLRSEPESGLSLAPKSSISIVISDGPSILTVPALAGLSRDEAIAAIENAGFVYLEADERREFSASVPDDHVISGTTEDGAPLPQEMAEQSAIRLVVSEGNVPAVEGQSEADAMATLDAVGLKGDVVDRPFSSDVPEGVVISQSTTTDPVVAGDTINLVVSKGPDLVEVPKVEGEKLKNAVKKLEDAGFQVSHRVPELFIDSARVVSSNPPAGEKIERGSTVELTTEVKL